MDPNFRGASKKARDIFKRRDAYLEKTPETILDRNTILRNMRKDGINVSDEQEYNVFKEVAGGKKFLYDKYLK